MGVSTTAAAVISVLCLINMVLLLGVVRRQGEHGRLLTEHNRMLAEHASRPGQGGSWPVAIDVVPGEKVGDFAVTAFGGGPVTRADLKGTVLVGFLAPGCPACEAGLPTFISRAESAPGGRAGVLAVVMGGSPEAADMCARLAPVATVLTEDQENGPLARAFGVAGLPAFALLADATVIASHTLIERLPGARADAGNANTADAA